MSGLSAQGYKKCFFVGGGNSMHLLESASKLFECIPFVHEVSAAIAAEYFNAGAVNGEKAFVLVTAGPGLTNLISGIAGAWLDSRELLVIGGQSKSTNLAEGKVRQIGHQEVDGVGITRPITKISRTLDSPISNNELIGMVSQSWEDRKGPVFIEVCLDVSAMNIDVAQLELIKNRSPNLIQESEAISPDLIQKFLNAKRPLLLFGGGVAREIADSFRNTAEKYRLPIACTWTGADRCDFDYAYYAGRPNNYGMRWANVFQQQADLLIAVGTSLGYQQTGFNTDEYLPLGSIIHVDIDKAELQKNNPKRRYTINSSAKDFLVQLESMLNTHQPDYSEWTDFLAKIRFQLPILEQCQISSAPFVSPQSVIKVVSEEAGNSDLIVAASSGGTFTATMQNFENKRGQILMGNKGLASMGYGLAGAIGLSLSRHQSRVILFEGDGGFAQNMQELGTVVAQNQNIKIFITCNDGYASIRTSQKSYFNGNYLGCDTDTGLQLPNWELLAEAYGIRSYEINSETLYSKEFKDEFNSNKSVIFLIMADPEQMYLPKIMSKIGNNGSMVSSPLHDMFPKIDIDNSEIYPYFSTDLILNPNTN